MPTESYKTNLQCGSCVAKLTPILNQDPNIVRWSVDTQDPNKVLTVEVTQLAPDRLAQHLASAGFRLLEQIPSEVTHSTEPTRSFWQVYKPLLLVVAYLLGSVLLFEFASEQGQWQRAMRHFMAGFFLIFSFFKMLDLAGFARSFRTYDLLALALPGWALLYPFLELCLGLAYVTNVFPWVTNLVTCVVMTVGLLGVGLALLRKQKIQCACLGTVFNLPMSKVTLIEDALMAGMACVMLLPVGHVG